MNHAETLERVKKKSTICPKCGCFVSSLLDCCPACGYKDPDLSIQKAKDELRQAEQNLRDMRNYYNSKGYNGVSSALFNAYVSIGGNAATDHLYNVLNCGEDGTIVESKRHNLIVIDSLTDIGRVDAQLGRVVYIRKTNQFYIYDTNEQWTQIYAPSLSYSSDVVETTTLGATTILYKI